MLLQSLSEYQGLIDFTGYLERQTRRLQVDPRYPPELYVPQRLEFPVDGGSAEPTDALEALTRLLDSPLARFILVLGDFAAGCGSVAGDAYGR